MRKTTSSLKFVKVQLATFCTSSALMVHIFEDIQFHGLGIYFREWDVFAMLSLFSCTTFRRVWDEISRVSGMSTISR